MKNALLLTGVALFALGGTAIAQTGTPPADSSTTGTMAPPDSGMAAPDNGTAQPDAGTASPDSNTAAMPSSDPGTASPTTQGTPSAPAAGDQSSAPPATPMASGSASDAVQKDWAKYDPQNTGSLTPLAFGSWLMASRGQDMTSQVNKTRTGKQANLPAVKVLNATASDFAKADTDHDRKITPAELTAYLSM